MILRNKETYWLILFSCSSEYGLSSESMTCLSRTDVNKNLFDGKQKLQIGKKKRWNFFLQVEIKDGHLLCQDKRYSIDHLCDFGIKRSQQCTFKDGSTYEIHPL